METAVRTYSNDEALVRERRSHIVKIAFKLFWEKGYRDTSMRELAEACGMSQGAIYRYISSKDDILHLICLEKTTGGSSINTLIDRLKDASATEMLRVCMTEYIRWEDRDSDYIIFFSREIQNFSKEDRRRLLKSQVELQEVFETILRKGISTEEFVIESPLLVAHNILMMGQDWASRRWFLSQHFTLEEYTKKQIEGVLKEIALTKLVL